MSLLKLYHGFDLKIEKAEGVYLYASSGEKYIDTFSGIAVMNLGHSHKSVLDAMQEKMNRYMHLSNFFLDEDAEIVAEMLITPTKRKGKVFYTNSGAEAVEAALKCIKKISKNKKIVYFRHGFHGRTLGALSVNGFENLKQPFAPLLPYSTMLEFNDEEALSLYMEKHGTQTAAIIIEPIQGSGGIVPLKESFSDALMKWKSIYNFAIICDEIQAGLGRTGTFYSYEHFSMQPDIIVVAKALGAGLPLGATLFLDSYADILKPGDHGTTFAPNPIALTGAKVFLDILPDILSSVKEKGEYFAKKLVSLSSNIAEIRSRGLMLGVLLKKEDPTLRARAFEKKLLLNVLANKLVRLLPALTIEYKEIDEIVSRLENVL